MTDRTHEVLLPHLEPGQPDYKGEQGLHCVLPGHPDSKRSASINFEKDKWYCHACQIGGTIAELLQLMDQDKPFDENAVVTRNGAVAKPLPSEATIKGWHQALRSNKPRLGWLQMSRGLNLATLTKYEIGWDSVHDVYAIPIRDSNGELVNVRRYDPEPGESRRKIWGITGRNSPVLYPVDQLDNEFVGVVEGEWDALLAIQNGLPAVTRTGAAKVWNSAWNIRFNGKKVWVCHDTDKAGQLANQKVSTSLAPVATEVRVVTLPYEITEKDGRDLTDYLHEEGYSPEDLLTLIKSSPIVHADQVGDNELVDINVLDSFDSSMAGQAMRMRVTITGRRNPPYHVPKDVQFRCAIDAGPKCALCPLSTMAGSYNLDMSRRDPDILEMAGATTQQVQAILQKAVGIPKCSRVAISNITFQAVEELYARPSVEIARAAPGQAGEYVNRKLHNVGVHDTMANSTVEVVGTIYPNPRSQHNEFQAWELNKTETAIDRFEMSGELLATLGVFQLRGRQRPLARLADVARDYATHVTHIYGRPEMHAAIDLTFHSALAFEFDGTMISRGWLELLIVGDTRTGKSEVGVKMVNDLGAGEVISCESATFAGVVGGLQQFGGKEWEVTWGAIPLNDRRAVLLDEIGGLTHEQIAQMSSIRSSGEAQLTKIRSERTWARTRLVWMGNPRNRRLSDYTHGVQAIRDLIGNNEDIARFDLAMSVGADEVEASEINKPHTEGQLRAFPQDACRLLLQWAWSRRPEHIFWDAEATAEVYRLAQWLGKHYTEDPPLIQAANVRIKIARLAVALAVRTFSTDHTGELVLVKKAHVEDAVRFMDMLYSMEGFGYRTMSREALADVQAAWDFYEDAKSYLRHYPGLAKFLRSMGKFRAQDMQDMLNLEKDSASAIINKLWELRMIRRQGPNILLQPVMHELLREVK